MGVFKVIFVYVLAENQTCGLLSKNKSYFISYHIVGRFSSENVIIL